MSGGYPRQVLGTGVIRAQRGRSKPFSNGHSGQGPEEAEDPGDLVDHANDDEGCLKALA